MIAQTKIDIPIYNQTLILAYGHTDEYHTWIKETYSADDTLQPGVCARTIEVSCSKQRDLILFINSAVVSSFGVKYHELVPHEIIHVAGFIFEYAGVKYSFDNDEVWAYLVGYLNRQVFLEMYKHLK